MITGTEGSLEVRTNVDPAGADGGEHLIQVDRTGTHRIDCSGGRRSTGPTACWPTWPTEPTRSSPPPTSSGSADSPSTPRPGHPLANLNALGVRHCRGFTGSISGAKLNPLGA